MTHKCVVVVIGGTLAGQSTAYARSRVAMVRGHFRARIYEPEELRTSPALLVVVMDEGLVFATPAERIDAASDWAKVAPHLLHLLAGIAMVPLIGNVVAIGLNQFRYRAAHRVLAGIPDDSSPDEITKRLHAAAGYVGWGKTMTTLNGFVGRDTVFAIELKRTWFPVGSTASLTFYTGPDEDGRLHVIRFGSGGQRSIAVGADMRKIPRLLDDVFGSDLHDLRRSKTRFVPRWGSSIGMRLSDSFESVLGLIDDHRPF